MIGYTPNFDYSKRINEQTLLRKTEVILALIYRDYLCDEETKQRLIEMDNIELEKIEKEKREKYNIDKVFEVRKVKAENLLKEKKNEYENENVAMIEYKENIFSKIILKLKTLFKKNK